MNLPGSLGITEYEGVDTLASYTAADAIAFQNTVRIAHLSDLHFVTHPIFRRLTFSGLHGHNEDAVNALRTVLTELRPDLLFVTGDQTTWGDLRSLRSSFTFIEELRQGLALSPERVVWIPGNHDILLDYYFGIRFRRRKYETVFGAPEPLRLLSVNGYRVGIFSFDSTLDRKGEWSPLWPLIGSRGRISPKSFNEFNRSLQRLGADDDVFMIAQVHHHPLPIPYKNQKGVTVELTTMTNGATFIAHMQGSGIALVLHGHEHIPYSCRYCYEPALPNCIVVAAGTASQRNSDQMSFNYLEVLPKKRVVVLQYDYRETGFYKRRDATKVWDCRPQPSP